MLVGTASVAKSERLASLLLRKGIPHEVLNAKQHAREAAIIANAGRKGAVTVATNMAGRGTDIMLGGNPEFIADAALRERGLSPDETPEEYEAAWADALDKAKDEVAKEHDEVVELGGLYVLGTERHESRRIDNQLRGRSGRQGDPGRVPVLPLPRRRPDGAVQRRAGRGDDELAAAARGRADRGASRSPRRSSPRRPRSSSRTSRSARTSSSTTRCMNKQRTVIYDERRKVLEGADLSDQIRPMIDDVVTGYVEGATASGYAEEWELDQLWTALKTLYPVSLTIDEAIEQAGGEQADLTREFLRRGARRRRAGGLRRSARRSSGAEVMRELERRVLLSVLDRKWREHLYEMDYLQEGIGLRAMAQRDPLVEYQREGFDMFAAMMDAIKEESVGFLFNLEVQVEDQAAADGTPAITVGAPSAGTDSAPAPVAAPAAEEPDVGVDETDQPRLSAALLQQAQAEHEAKSAAPNGARRGAKDAPAPNGATGDAKDAPTPHIKSRSPRQ